MAWALLSVGFSLNLIWFAGGLCGVVAAMLHVVLGRAAVLTPPLARHRAVVLGGLGGLCGTVSVAWAMTWVAIPGSM